MCQVNAVLQSFLDICTHCCKLPKPQSKPGYVMEEWLEKYSGLPLNLSKEATGSSKLTVTHYDIRAIATASEAAASRIGWTRARTRSTGAGCPPNQLDSAAGLPVAALAALVSETPGTISGERLAVNFKWIHNEIKQFESSQKIWLSIKFLLYSSKFLCTIFGPRGNFTSNDVFVNLFDSVRSKIN